MAVVIASGSYHYIISVSLDSNLREEYESLAYLQVLCNSIPQINSLEIRIIARIECSAFFVELV